MKHPSTKFSQLYEATLRSHLDQNSPPDPEVVQQIDNKVRAARMTVLDYAKLHEYVMAMEILPSCPAGERAGCIRNAGIFFAATIATTWSEKKDVPVSARAKKTIESLSGRTVELTLANRQLGLDIIQCKMVETVLRKRERDLLKSLDKSEVLNEQLRGLSRQIMLDQEDERRKISRELHDVIAQALLAINVRLATLKSKAGINTKEISRNIDLSQKMITKSADIVHQFTSKLRPAVLDDLGLIPALHTLMKNFTKRTGVRMHLTVFAGVEKLSAMKRTVLYRVAQEALSNVASHAHASNVKVTISRDAKFALMEVSDDGCSFQVEQVLLARGSKHIGLLSMRERIEMVGGHFEVESVAGKGTKIIARIPFTKATLSEWRINSVETKPYNL
jgi:signal transduction histidine kinase